MSLHNAYGSLLCSNYFYFSYAQEIRYEWRLRFFHGNQKISKINIIRIHNTIKCEKAEQKFEKSKVKL